MTYSLCIHVNAGPWQTFSKKYSEINAKNLHYRPNVHVILSGTYIKKKVYLKNTNRASIKEITDFGMILRPYKLLVIGSFHAKTTTFQKSCQVTPSDFADIHTVCSSIGRINTQKKSGANSERFWKYSSSKIWPDPPPFLASVRRVIDLFDLWPAFIPDCNKIQKSKLLLGVIFTHIFKIWSQKHDILFSFYARGTSTWALVTYDNYFFNVQGHAVSEQKATGGLQYLGTYVHPKAGRDLASNWLRNFGGPNLHTRTSCSKNQPPFHAWMTT